MLGHGKLLARCSEVLQSIKSEKETEQGILDLLISDPRSRTSGIYAGKEYHCPPAIDFLAGKLYRNEYGPSLSPHELLFVPRWHEGTTLPSR